MGFSFVLIAAASFICAFAPQEQLGFDISYALFIFGRFLLACATRGVTLTGFVIGKYSNQSLIHRFRSISLFFVLGVEIG